MSAMEKNSWPEAQGDTAASQGEASEATKPKAERPTLVAPPARPVRPATPKPTPSVVAPVVPAAEKPPEKAPLAPEPAPDPEAYRYLPIAPPSEPMQYRAIGLVRGTYVPTEAEQLNRGNLATDDGLTVDSVLLGRVTSLVKKHLDLTAPHLWVVYPRTRRETETDEEQDLHFQIVGVWEPETLGLPGEDPQSTTGEDSDETMDSPTDVAPEDGETKATKAKGSKAKGSKDSKASQDVAPSTQVAPAAWPAVDENYFSIRGEVVKHEPEQGLITVKILQGIKRTPGGAKSFKLTLQGHIEGRTVGYFWDFQVKRDAKILAVETASVVGIVPPKKRPKGSTGGRRPGVKRPGGPRSSSAPPRKPTGTHGSPRPRKVVPDPGDTPAS